MKHTLKKLIALATVLALVLAFAPVSALALDSSKLNFAVISDIHYYPESYSDNYSDAFIQWGLSGNKQYAMQEGLIDSAFAAIKEHSKGANGIKYVIIPGDLTHNGEYLAHTELAAKLEQLEEETGVQVIVINGNHDINNYSAKTFENGKAESVRCTTADEFREIYKNLGYDLAVSEYTPPEGEEAGGLSYSVVVDGYRIILMDGGKYSADSTDSGEASHETGGNYSESLWKWILDQTAQANANGETIVGVTHWSIVPHYVSQATLFQDFPIDNNLYVSETLADAGMHYVFTGHSHSNDISSHVSDNGEIIYDCQTNSLMEFPNYFREISFTSNDGETTCEYNTLDVDCVLPVTDVFNTTFAQPYRTTTSFNYTYKGSLTNYVMGLITPTLVNLFGEITETGGIVKYLAAKGYDLDAIMRQYVGDGIVVGDEKYITPDNVMAFVNDLGSQIDEKYIKDTDYTMGILKASIEDLLSLKVSDYPCTGLLDEYGYGSTTEPGTFGDAALCTMIGMWAGDEDISDDFMQDVLARFRTGELAHDLFDKLYKVLVNDLVEDEILSNLYVNVDTVFADTPYPEGGAFVQLALNIASALFGKDTQAANDFAAQILGGLKDGNVSAEFPFGKTSYLSFINMVLSALDAADVLKGGDIDGVLDVLMDEYLTESQFEAWGETFAFIIEDIGGDSDPALKSDCHAVLSYTGKTEVVPTAEDYRLPSLVSVSFGDDSAKTRNISWYSKYSLTKTDIEIVPYSENPVFTGTTKVPRGVFLDRETQAVTRSFPGADLGIIGILDYDVNLTRHIVRVEGLKAGQKYCYRVGDAEKGWWSDVGVIETADNSNEVTFIHTTDAQAQNTKQYGAWSNTLETAFSMFPDADFVVNSGDMVDMGGNLNQWKYFFDTASDSLMSTALMPVAGNHEAKGDFALDQNFVLPTAPQQDTTDGYYYSFDYNNVHFIMLNTNDTSSSSGLSENQIKWLTDDAKMSNAQWKIVVMHKAVYSNGSHIDDSEVVKMREQLSVLMPELDIDLVLQGHDHVYLRTEVIKNNENVPTETTTVNFNGTDYNVNIMPDGTMYEIGATSGVKYYNAKDAAETANYIPEPAQALSLSAPVFSAIQIKDNMLYFDAYLVTGDTQMKIDSFAIAKKSSTVLKGDVDLDGDIDTDDARLTLRAVASLTTLTLDQRTAAEVDGVYGISTTDARMILRMAAHLPVNG